jgi:demethylmenaquinone methyltransferase / 2-methoxy-6-polyprenyl-1,4-benzoquinol methylase
MAYLQGQDRADYVQDMFARIAGRYDRMNRLMTFGQDVHWREYVIRRANLPAGGRLLDIATGTGDIADEGLEQVPGLQAVGGDFTIEMMQAGKRLPGRETIRWVASDTLALPFPDNTFDAVTSGFLMRNVIDVPGAFREQLRVTRPGGRVVVLESSPQGQSAQAVHQDSPEHHVIPTLGRIVTGEADAYRYLPDSTQGFQGPDELAATMRAAGYVDVGYRLFMFGTIAIHVGTKPD